MVARADKATLRSLPDDVQRRLDHLMAAHNEGQLTSAELDELRRLVADADEIARSNARRLVEYRRKARTSAASDQRVTDG